MPFYEYECHSCAARHEVFQRMSEAALTECTTCGGPVRRVIFPAGIILKGGGFYATEYGKGKTASSTSSESKSSDSTSAAPGEKKPATAGGDGKTTGSTTSAGGASSASTASACAKAA